MTTPELVPAIELDARAIDREIGVTAAFALNAIVTAFGMPYSELEQQRIAGKLRSDLSDVFERTEATVSTHIGKREENDTLFHHLGTSALEPQDKLPEELIPYSEIAETLKRTTIDDEHIAENSYRLDSLARSVAEPFENAFLDKTSSRRRLQSGTGKTEWQSERNGVTHSYDLRYKRSREGAQLESLVCRTDRNGLNSSTSKPGVLAEADFDDNKIRQVRVIWQEPGRSVATLPHRSLEMTKLDKVIAGLQGNETYHYTTTALSIDLAERRVIIFAPFNKVTYRFDALQGKDGLFVSDYEDFDDFDTDTFTQLLKMSLNAFPTTQIA